MSRTQKNKKTKKRFRFWKIKLFLFLVLVVVGTTFGLVKHKGTSRQVTNSYRNISAMRTKPFALSLGGGGGRGPYQIGMWRALEENNMFRNITSISGTSVGALNALLFAICTRQEAEALWRSITPHDLLEIDVSTSPFGVCSRDKLREILSALPLEKLKTAVPVYVKVYNTTTETTENIKLNDLPSDKVVDYLIAASALPLVYPQEEIDGDLYRDGGYGGFKANIIYNYTQNEPFDIHYMNGYRLILVSSLFQDFKLNKLCKEDGDLLDVKKEYPNCNFVVIRPDKAFNVTATLDFSPAGVNKRIEQGYRETMEMLANGK